MKASGGGAPAAKAARAKAEKVDAPPRPNKGFGVAVKKDGKEAAKEEAKP